MPSITFANPSGMPKPAARYSMTAEVEGASRWVLVSGSPVKEKPAAVSGWLIESKDRGPVFVTTGGSVFRPIPYVVVGPAFLPNPAPKK